jgi:hypothetical protein
MFITVFWPGTNKIQHKIYHNNKNDIHRKDGPAHISYDVDGKTITHQKWYKNGKLYRANGQPSSITYYKDTGNLHSQMWIKDEISYREDGGPIYIEYEPDGVTFMYKLWMNLLEVTKIEINEKSSITKEEIIKDISKFGFIYVDN